MRITLLLDTLCSAPIAYVFCFGFAHAAAVAAQAAQHSSHDRVRRVGQQDPGRATSSWEFSTFEVEIAVDTKRGSPAIFDLPVVRALRDVCTRTRGCTSAARSIADSKHTYVDKQSSPS
eukprot:COSAG02_NODE_4043_length_5866_cov_3.711462_5_plen_119_part_00